MRCQPISFYVFATFGLLLFGSWRWPLQTDTTTTVQEIAPGVTLTQTTTLGTAPLMTYVLHIDRHTPGVRIQVRQALDIVSYGGAAQGRETMSHIAGRTGAIAAINGDFFPFNGDPTSLEIRDGELLSEPIGYRVAVGLSRDTARMQILTSRGVVRTDDKTEILLNGINHLPHEGETVVLTASYAAGAKLKEAATVVTVKGAALPFHVSRDLAGNIDSVLNIAADQPLPHCDNDTLLIVGAGSASAVLAAHCAFGDALHVRYDLLAAPPLPSAPGGLDVQDAPHPLWQDVEQAVGGGPWLVRDGEIFVDGDAERLSPTDFVNARHARSAIGICKDGSVLLVAVDGKSPVSRGVTLPELADILKRAGAQQAINLDGGGSTAMVVAGRVINTPSDGRERPVANGILVFADAQKNKK